MPGLSFFRQADPASRPPFCRSVPATTAVKAP